MMATTEEITPVAEVKSAQVVSKMQKYLREKPGADIADYFNFGFTEDAWNENVEKQRILCQEHANSAIKPVVIGSAVGLNLSGGNSPQPLNFPPATAFALLNVGVVLPRFMNALSFSPPLLDSTFPLKQLPGFRSQGNGLMPLLIPSVIRCGPGARHPPHTSPNIMLYKEDSGREYGGRSGRSSRRHGSRERRRECSRDRSPAATRDSKGRGGGGDGDGGGKKSYRSSHRSRRHRPSPTPRRNRSPSTSRRSPLPEVGIRSFSTKSVNPLEPVSNASTDVSAKQHRS
ncbi:unnamed protein product [Rodentolepis nana]|uniref:Pre-mRNA 3'-end-processing factor FIP1 n=1 Tax=Rodentolepis nana TaxID=102285 RepID=A0A0R3TWE3_RODNA|nr:unnamed protein product [Rodentolepis nana]